MVKRAESYTQCTLRKDTAEQTAWIPSHFARKGNVVKVMAEDGWTDGWEVVAVHQTQTGVVTEERETDYRRQRRASDV